MIKFDGNNIKELDFSDIYVVDKWTKKLIIEIQGLRNEMGTCKYKILQAKWNSVIYWYMMISYRIMNSSVTVDDFMHSLRDSIKQYEKVICDDDTIFKKLYKIFAELHSVATTEFIHVSSEFIDKNNNSKINDVELIDSIGESLYKIMISSIFEISEIDIKCETTECPFYNHSENQSVRFLISDLYNVNSFSIYKLEKFIELLDVENTNNITFIADFTYFSEEWVNPNLFIMLETINKEFKILKIRNLNKNISNAVRKRFPENVKN